jgi:hypothetical protein
MKVQILENEIIRGEFPTTIPDTHILVYDWASGEGSHESYFLVPKELWEEFDALRKKVKEQAELVYEIDEYYSPSTSIYNAYPYVKDEE